MSVVVSGIGRGLAVQSGDWSAGRTGEGREAGFERGCIRDTARIQRVLIRDRYALESERVILYPTIPDQAIKFGRRWSGVGRLSGVNVPLDSNPRSSLPRVIPAASKSTACFYK